MSIKDYKTTDGEGNLVLASVIDGEDYFSYNEMRRMKYQQQVKILERTKDYLLTVIQTHIDPMSGQFPDIDEAIEKFEQRIKNVKTQCPNCNDIGHNNDGVLCPVCC